MKPAGKISIIFYSILPVAIAVSFNYAETKKLLSETPGTVFLFYFFIIILAVVSAWRITNEIIKRRKSEKELRTYTELVNQMQVLIRDMNGRIIYWNDGMEKLYGWKREEVIGKVSDEVLCSVLPQPANELTSLLLSAGEWQGEIKHLHKKGHQVYVSSHWSLIRNEQGKPVSIIETNNDSTALRNAQGQVATLSREINQSREAIYSLDADQRIKSWNRGAEALYGFSPEEAMGKKTGELMRTRFNSNTNDAILSQLAKNDQWAGEIKRTTRDGRELEVHTSVNTIREYDGSISGYTCISFDVTEQVRLREQANYLATLVDQSTEAILSVSLDGVLFSWNPGAERLFGYRADEVLGRNISLIFPPDLRNEEASFINKIKTAQKINQFETHRVRKDGSLVYISVTATPLKNKEGIITGVLGVARDISEKKEAERKIIQSEENLQTIFENASEGFILTDANFIIKSFNRWAAETPMFSMVEKIMPGKSLLDLIPLERKEMVTKLLKAAMQGQTIQIDRHYVKPNGETSWLNLTYHLVKKNKNIQGLCITVRDITDKKIAEQQREFDANNLNALINNTHDLMWSVDLNFNLITSNHAFNEMIKAMSGRTVEKGTNILDWQFDKAMQDRFKGFYERAFSGEAFTEIEYTKTSFEYWGENSFYPIYEGNKVIGTACFSRDISKQKQAAQQLQNSFHEKWALAERMSAILNTLPATIALLNNKGIIIDVNNAWKNFAGGNGFLGNQYGIGQNYLNITEKSFCGETDGKLVSAGIRSVIDQKKEEFVFEYACHSPTEERWFRMVASPLKDKEYEGAVVMHVDISKLKKLEQERLEIEVNEQKKITRAMMEAQEKERDELGRELHDNLCQLLAALKMKLSFCMMDFQNSLPVIKESVNFLEDAINETRNLSHRMLMPRFTESSLADALQNLTTIYTHNQRHVELEVVQSEQQGTPAPLKETLYRIAQEQLNNIEKYAKASEVKVHLSTDPALITMVIEDNGIGFDAMKRRTGTGLTNIMNRAESFNGSAKIISSPGEGCVLLVEIPLAV